MLTEVVPDLVFSEMRFLQKPEPSTKKESDPKPKKKPRKNVIKPPRKKFQGTLTLVEHDPPTRR
jgi:hypothetical protein